MSEQWLGLHNPVRHGPLQQSVAGPFRHCSCGLNCLESNPCLCCLAAEVETLRAQVQELEDQTEAAKKAVGEERYNPWPHLRDWGDVEVTAWTHEGVRHERQRCCPTREVTR